MLGKLIKHDFHSLSRVLVPTQLAVIAATILATLGFVFNYRTGISNIEASGLLSLLKLITGFLSGIMVLAIIAASVIVAFIIFQRFYKNLMCSEGYLTFTLPVTTSEILWSKLITAMLWTIISSVVIFISINIFVLFGTADSGFINTEAYREIGKMLHELNATIGARVIWPVLECILFVIVATACSILQVYLALIIGAIASQKHKILAAIGFYFVINIAVSIISTIVQYFMAGSMVNSFSKLENMDIEPVNALEAYKMIVGAVQPYFWVYLVFTIALTAGFFLLSRYFLKNKLNLE
ncbi:MAG: hypothetical protein KBI01_04215 [Oscillospiraceae bacterium]|nr:hypothetical protein [Oscillospiraceae bacterium]